MASRITSGGKRSMPVIAGSGTSLEQDQFIEAQLLRTRRRVKLVDLGTVGMGFLGGMLAFLLVCVVIDHWVMDLGWGGRVGALILLGIALGYGAAGRLVPLIRRGVNPVYAAKAIEQSEPSLKNSLINFLMFRRDASTTSRLVHQALRQRAALDLQQVNLDLAVDQTRMIRLGYAVVALMVLFAAYTVFSPKDVFQTMRRVAVPWADISRPTRVRITDVEPGDVSRVFGARVTVSARIHGVRPDETVRLLYTTDDSQTVNREILMASPAPGQRYEGTLPVDLAGLQQNVTYHIEAGDGRTAGFRVEVTATPSILVQRVEYEYPPYTRRERREVEREGEVSGLEGTRVTVRALTNHPIKTASIEFNPSTASSPDSSSVGRIQPMEFRGQEAWSTFTLQWDHDRQVPVHSSYRLAFTTMDDLRSEDGMIYRILVSRDLSPEIAILAPKEDDIHIRLNATQRIEVRAIDPDFGLSRVVLRAVTGGRNLLEEPLLVDGEGRVGQVVVDYDFSPSRLGLSAGDRVTFWAFAEDNRSLPLDTFGGANSERTRDYAITILPPDPGAPPAGAGPNRPAVSGWGPPRRGEPEAAATGRRGQFPAERTGG